MDYIIIYEKKNRELENALLLKIELELRGYECSVIQFYEGNRFNVFGISRPKVILAPNLYEYKSIPRIYSRFGRSQLVNLQYEQVLSEKWEKIGHHNPKSEAKKAIHVCWGPKTRDRLTEAGVPKGNLKVIGALQLDLLRKEYRRNTSSVKQELAQEFKLDETKRWALFISSFTYADISESKLSMNESISNTNLSSFVKVHTSSRDSILDWLKRILEQDTDNIIIYRPHPDELSLNKVIELEKKYLNFRIIRDRSVKTWIESCDNIYSWYSTSVVESHFLNKPYAILRPLELPNDFESVLLKYSKYIKSYEEFENDYFKNDSERILPINESYIRQYYQVDNDKPSFIKYCDMLEEVYSSEDKQIYDIKLIDKIKAKIMTVMVILVNFAYRVSNIKLDKYRKRNKNNSILSWFIEMDDQIASDKEKKDIEDRLVEIIFSPKRKE